LAVFLNPFSRVRSAIADYAQMSKTTPDRLRIVQV
jgi:hypothetical protein